MLTALAGLLSFEADLLAADESVYQDLGRGGLRPGGALLAIGGGVFDTMRRAGPAVGAVAPTVTAYLLLLAAAAAAGAQAG